MSRGPDYQKQEAKTSLWDMDGQHIKKRFRNKGKGRGKDKREILANLDENRGFCDDERTQTPGDDPCP